MRRIRRSIWWFGAAVLTLALATPASAVPKAFSFDVACDMDRDGSSLETSFVSIGNHYPGWNVPWSPGDGLSGGILLGGTQTTTLNGTPVGEPFTWGPPPGLASRVTLCRIRGPLEETPYKISIDPAYVLFPTAPAA